MSPMLAPIAPPVGQTIYPPPQQAPPPPPPPPVQQAPVQQAPVQQQAAPRAELSQVSQAPPQEAPPQQAQPQPTVVQAAPQSAPPVQQSTGPTVVKAAPTSITQAAAQQPAAQQGPVSTGSAADAIGATTAQIPNLVTAAPQATINAAKGLPENVDEFVAGKNPRVYQPAAPGVKGESQELHAGEIEQAMQGLGTAASKVAQGDLGNIGNVLGAAKDVGLAHVVQNTGEISPIAPRSRQAIVDAMIYAREHNGQYPEWATKCQVDAPGGGCLVPSIKDAYGNSMYSEIATSSDPNFSRAAKEGYTAPDGMVYGPGWQAVWNYWQDGNSGLQKATADVLSDPVGTAADVAATVLTGGGEALARRGVQQGVRFAAEEGGAAAARAAAMRVGGKAIGLAGRGVDIAGSFGLSEAVPAAFRIGKAGYEALPWLARQTTEGAQRAEVEAAQQAAQGMLATRRSAEGQQGVPGVTAPSQISHPTPDSSIYRVAVPPDATGAGGIDITYHVDKDGKLNGVYDVAVPGPTDRYRPITTADADAIWGAVQILGDADRQALRQSAFPQLTRHETAPNEPYLDPGADKVFDINGNEIATGRSGAGSDRVRDDLRDTILRSGRPDQIVTDFTKNWQETLYDNTLHPLTRRPVAQHRLQMLRDVLDALPASYRTPEIEAHYRQMKSMLPTEPHSVGTDVRWRGDLKPPAAGQPPNGMMVPIERTHADWLRRMVQVDPREFNRSGVLDADMVGGKKGTNLVYNRKPGPNALPAYKNGYETYKDLETLRLSNPPIARREMGSLYEQLDSLRRSSTDEDRRMAIKEVLERKIPGISQMNTDQAMIAITNYLRDTKPQFPTLPGASPTPPHGIYVPGSEDERWGMSLAPKLKEAMERTIDLGGTRRTAGELLFGHFHDNEIAATAARRMGTVGNTPADARHLAAQVNKIQTRIGGEYKNLTEAQLGNIRPAELDRITAALLKSDMQISQGVRSASGKLLTPGELKGPVGKALGVYDQFVSMWRSTVLYNIGRGIQYPMLQLFGNSMSGAIAAREALPYYWNPVQLYKGFRYLRDPETELLPDAIKAIDKLNLPRRADLGRGGRDQLGPRTAFRREGAHPVTKAIGAVLGNQTIKDIADSFDQGWRLALWWEAFQPAYNRLKKDLVPMAEQRFRSMGAARGVPFNISRDQIARTIKRLDTAESGYFDQPTLRQALYEMGGGAAAPNQQALKDIADRVARDYKAEYDKLDDLAIAKVQNIAFSGGDTNASQALQRMFMFTWWTGNATRQFAIEAAKSPIQMGLWARAIHDSQRQQATGTAPGYASMVDFLATPAGYTVAFNKYALLGTWLLGNSSDPASETANLTAFGRFMDGDVGDNIILSPILKGLAYTLGAMGQDARAPDISGGSRLEKELADGLNMANQLFGGFLAHTKGGNPEHIPQLNISQRVVSRLAQEFSGIVPGTQKVAGYDPDAGYEAQMTALIADQIIRDNPDLDPNDPIDAETIEQGVNRALIDHDSPYYQEALGRYTDGQYAGPGTTGEGGWRDVLGGVTSHWVLPTNFSRQPTFRDDRNERIQRDKERKAGSQTLAPEAEATKFDKMLGGLGSETTEARKLDLVRAAADSDPVSKATADMKNHIQYGELEKSAPSVNIDGFTFTAEQIKALPETDRRALANRWVAASNNQATMDAYYANKDAQLKSDKRYADGEGLPKYAKQYPGGIDRFVDDTAQVNPNYKRFIEGSVYDNGELVFLPDLRLTDHARWVKLTTEYDDAKNVIAGVKDNRYGMEIDPKYAGVVAGLDQNMPVGAWLLEQNAAEASNDSDYTTTMKSDYETINALGAALDQLDAQWGQPIGTNRATMNQRLINGEQYPVDIPTKDALNALTGGIDTTLDNPKALSGYINWNLQQPAGVPATIDDYNQAYFAQKDKARVQELAALLATGQAPKVGPDGKAVLDDALAGMVLSGGVVSPGVRAAQDQTIAPTQIVSEPGGQDVLVEVPAGMQLLTTERMIGTDGSQWVHVTEPNGGLDGWVNANTMGATATQPAAAQPLAAAAPNLNGSQPLPSNGAAATFDPAAFSGAPLTPAQQADLTERRTQYGTTPVSVIGGTGDVTAPGSVRTQVVQPPGQAPVQAVPAPAAPPWYEQAGSAIGDVFTKIGQAGASVLNKATGAVQGTMTGGGTTPTKPAVTSQAAREMAPSFTIAAPPASPRTAAGQSAAAPAVPAAGAGQPFYYDVTPSQDGYGVQSTIAADRTWMEDMMGGHAAVTTDYKGPAPCAALNADGSCARRVSYQYQVGHDAIDGEHAAYDISCDQGNCAGTPVKSPVSGTVVCAGYGAGTGGALNANPSNNGCYYSAGTTTANNDGSGPAHTVTIQVGTDPEGNPIQLSLNHMGTSVLQPGQQIAVGDLIGAMGNTDGGPHTHVEAWGYSPALGTYAILDPTLVVGGYYQTHTVDDMGTSSMAPPSNGGSLPVVVPRTTPGLTPGDPAPYQPLVQQAAAEYGVPPQILAALLQQESQYDPGALSPAGAQGIAQFMPDTARGMGIDPYDPAQAIPGAAQYLADAYAEFGDWALAIASYNAGRGAVEQYHGVPPFPETQNYVDVIMGNASR